MVAGGAMETLADRLAVIEARIEAACRRAGRARESVTLIGVSKTFPVEAVREALAAGIRVLGENRVQEAAEKIAQLGHSEPGCRPEWHLIGHLQSNKARWAVELFDRIHSIDSVKLAEKVDAACQETGKRMPVFIEINLGGEASKAGVPEDEAPALCHRVSELEHLELCGLMTVPPFLDDPEDVRPFFRRLSRLRDHLLALGVVGPAFRDLSMGMSHDFETAIEEGATFVRVGTALFGSRG